MKISYPGLLREPMPSGNFRYRVRPQGEPKRRILIHCGPEHEEFGKQYAAARAGQQPDPVKKAHEYARPQSIGWLVNIYYAYLEERVKAGTTSAKTLKKKRNLLNRLLVSDADKVMEIPREKLIGMQDAMGATPAQADAFIEAVSVMYDWAVERKYIKENTAKGIRSVYTKGDGATPWKAADVKQFFAYHKPGTKPHVAMYVLLWTGCRIEDLTILGRAYECVIDGYEALRWIPLKKGSSEVCIPLFEPLKEATRKPKVQGITYVLGKGGKPLASGDSASAMFKRWCKDAGLDHLSAHGVRKGLAEVLAELGCSQYEIMAILGHSEAKTSEVYTRRVERWRLAKTALDRVNLSRSWS